MGETSLIGNNVEAEGVAGQLDGRRVSNDASSVSSSTKTKTAQLSDNVIPWRWKELIGTDLFS